MAEERVRLEVDGSIATIINDNPTKHNAFDDEMDVALFDILGRLHTMSEIKAVVWRGEGRSWSSGRDVGAIGNNVSALSHHELMRRGHRGIQQVFDLPVPIVVAVQGWAMGGSFQRALLCDIRIAATDARFRLPEVGHGVIPDTGGVARLYQMAGHGLVSDMVLTGRTLSAEEALAHGVVSRVVAPDELAATAYEMAQQIAAAPAATVRMARRVIANLGEAEVRRSMADELIFQTYVVKSDDMAEFRRARAEKRPGDYTGS